MNLCKNTFVLQVLHLCKKAPLVGDIKLIKIIIKCRYQGEQWTSYPTKKIYSLPCTEWQRKVYRIASFLGSMKLSACNFTFRLQTVQRKWGRKYFSYIKGSPLGRRRKKDFWQNHESQGARLSIYCTQKRFLTPRPIWQKEVYFLIIVFFWSSPLLAGFYDKKMEGWFWYEAKEKKPVYSKKPVPQPQTVTIRQNTPPSARKVLKQWQELLEESKAKAILYPTRENVKNYIVLQNDLMQRTETFSNSWLSVQYENPHLNYSVKHPYNPIALKPYYEEKNKNQEKLIQKVSQEYGFFFFYSSTCPHCHAFAPVLKKWSEMKGIKVIGVTMDGRTIEGFEDSKVDNGISRKFNITHVPSLVGVNPKTNHILPIAAGPLPIPEIENRIVHLVTGGVQ